MCIGFSGVFALGSSCVDTPLCVSSIALIVVRPMPCILLVFLVSGFYVLVSVDGLSIELGS
jgi:hypothetical protein